MNIISIIEKYIELSISRDNLEKVIRNARGGYYNARIESDYVSEKQEYAINELPKVEQQLAFYYEIYKRDVKHLNENQLEEVLKIISIKKADFEKQMNELSQRRTWAITKGDKAFVNYNYSEEQEYNRISSECFLEMEIIKSTLQYYEIFLSELNSYTSKKYGQTRLVK